MEQNSLIEIGSKANVILSFVIEKTINGKTYAALEPYLYLRDVNVVLEYKKNVKGTTTAKNQISYSDINVEKLTIGQIPFSRKLASLLLNYTASAQSAAKRELKSLVAADGVIYLTKEIFNEATLYIYDSNFNKITGAVYSAVNKTLTSESFVEGNSYLISFSSELVGTKFNLSQNHNSYMHAEIQTIGNIDKTEKEAIIYLEKIALSAMNHFVFIPEKVINTPLEFIILDGTNNYIVFED